MKIRTTSDLVDKLTDDFAWRRKELTLLLFEVKSSKDKTLPKAIRAGLVLLYAHWEGFIKNTSQFYLTFVNQQKLDINELSYCFVASVLRTKIIEDFEKTNRYSKHSEFIEYFLELPNKRFSPEISTTVQTKSNLNSEVLQGIFALIGIDHSHFATKNNLIDNQLVNYRNTIAHGQNLAELFNKSDYEHLHDEVLGMMSIFKTLVENAAITRSFKRK